MFFLSLRSHGTLFEAFVVCKWEFWHDQLTVRKDKNLKIAE